MKPSGYNNSTMDQAEFLQILGLLVSDAIKGQCVSTNFFHGPSDIELTFMVGPTKDISAIMANAEMGKGTEILDLGVH